jgi:hypothetical protein
MYNGTINVQYDLIATEPISSRPLDGDESKKKICLFEELG